jgi:tight adherence protein C
MSVALVLGLGSLAGAIALLTVAVAARTPATNADVAVPAELQARSARRNRATDAAELPPLLGRLKQVAARLTPVGYGKNLQRRLDLAGNPPAWPAARVLAFKGIGLVMGGLAGLVLGLHGGITLLLWPAVGAVIGFFLPDVAVRNAGEKRQIELQRALPDAIDMMTICVEAGLGFDAALARVARNLEGPVAAECARVLQEMQFGKSRSEALRALVERTDVRELRTFVSSLIQATEFGISIASVLREQSKEMRVRRRQRAEEKAQKLPVKILIPLITCLLPAMFVVILGPAVINIVHTLGHLNH